MSSDMNEADKILPSQRCASKYLNTIEYRIEEGKGEEQDVLLS